MSKNKLFLFSLALIILLSSFISANSEITIPCGGDGQNYVQCFGNNEINFLHGNLPPEGIKAVGGKIIEVGKTIFGLQPYDFYLLSGLGATLLVSFFLLIFFIEKRKKDN